MGIVFTKIRLIKLPACFSLKNDGSSLTKVKRRRCARSKSINVNKARLFDKNRSKNMHLDPTKDLLLELCRYKRWEHVRSIAQSNPKAVLHHDPFSYESPLHMCCSLGAPIQTLEAVALAGPEVTNWENSRQQRPIHAACFGAKNTNVIHKLLRINPRSAIALDGSGRTPLVCILSSPRCKNLSLKILQDLVSRTPPLILRRSDKSGFLPIDHLCVWMINNLKFSDQISSDGPFLPRHHPSEKFILSALSIFLKPVPETSFVAFDQLLKIDCSSRSCATLYLRNTILRIFLQAMNHYQRANSPDFGPNIYLIHHFINFDLSHKSFYFVEGNLNNSIAMAKATDVRGDLPLHVLLKKSRKNVTIFRRLIEIYPNAASRKDSYGNYPLHMAILKKMPFKVIQTLLNAYYPALGAKYIGSNTKCNGYFPVFLAAHLDADVSVIYLLLENFPALLSQ